MATKLGGWGISRENAPRSTSRTDVRVAIRTSRSRDGFLGGPRSVPRPREFEGASLVGPVREACRPAGLLASGSAARGLLPGRATGVGRSLASSGLPPEASPVTVAGAARDFHPLPFAERFKEPRRGRTITRPPRTCNSCVARQGATRVARQGATRVARQGATNA